MSYRWLYASEKVAICSDRLYAYYQNNDGIIANLRRTEALDTDRMQVLIRRAEFFEREREKELARLSWARALRFLYCDSMEYDGRCDAQLKSCLHGRWYTGYISAGMRSMCVRLRCACTVSCGSMCTNKKQMAQACHLPYVFSL